MSLRWLEWAPIDVDHSVGGVEVHIRCLVRELRALGVDAVFSNDPHRPFDEMWDVIHTHGCWPLPGVLSSRRIGGAVRLHTLHGTTLGRMAACQEWLWPGGYRAYAEELKGVLESDGILGVHPGLHLLSAADQLGKSTGVCWNGWDSGGVGSVGADEIGSVLPAGLKMQLEEIGNFLCYVGRGGDRVKNTDALIEATKDVRWPMVVVPGDGFPVGGRWVHTGVLSPEQVRAVMRMSRGLVLSSEYEGLPLVVLEALAQGVMVISTRVGGLEYLDAQLKGLYFLSDKPSEWMFEIQEFCHRSEKDRAVEQRAAWNQKRLPSWRKVAEATLELTRLSDTS